MEVLAGAVHVLLRRVAVLRAGGARESSARSANTPSASSSPLSSAGSSLGQLRPHPLEALDQLAGLAAL